MIVLSTLLTGPSGSGDTCDTTKYPAETIAKAMAMDSQTFVGFKIYSYKFYKIQFEE